MSEDYDDIIHLPHHTSIWHPRMAVPARAAQFAPFAALAGYDAAVEETARLTCERPELDEYVVNALSVRLQILTEHLAERPEITITYFLPDHMKNGGAYVTLAGVPRKVEEFSRLVILTDGTAIPFADIVAIEGSLFAALNCL